MHMMLDLETLALDPKAVVFQIGVVVFDMKTDEMPILMRFDVDILPQIMNGRVIDPSTQKWWMTQRRESWLRDPGEVSSVDYSLSTINRIIEKYEVEFVWANSPSFDCVILRSLAKDFDIQLRWDFRSEMDLRTIKTMNSIAKLPPADPLDTTHDALKDCIDQVKKVKHYWNNFLAKESETIVTGGS